MLNTYKLAFLALLMLSLTAGKVDCSPKKEETSDATPPSESEDQGEKMPAVEITTSSATQCKFTVELAVTNAQRERGLMYRNSLAPDHGMLFVFPDEAARSFWMKNTYISLDMIFINSDRNVVGIIERAEPLSTTPLSVNAPAQYVLEIIAGASKQCKITNGSRVVFYDMPY